MPFSMSLTALRRGWKCAILEREYNSAWCRLFHRKKKSRRHHMSSLLSRRQLLNVAGLAALAAALPRAAIAALTNKAGSAGAAPVPARAPSVPRRVLGKSQLTVPVISVGTGAGQSVAVLRYCLSQGINLIHTSTGYAAGRAIRNVGQAIKGQREKVVLALKITWRADDLRAFDEALKQLGVDSVDLALFNLHDRREVKNPQYAKAAERLKKAQKTKAIGLTTHGDMAACMQEALDQGFYDVLMPSFNLTMKKECLPIFERAAKAGVGIILMKTENGLGALTYQKAIPVYLGLPGVATINKTITTFQQCDSLLSAAATPAASADAHEVERLARLTLAGHCTMCGACVAACPRGVAVADLVRCSDYYLSRADYVTAVQDTLAELPPHMGPQACTKCGTCERVCPQHVPVCHHIQRIATVFG
ncbi:MAG: aldo/keto reductase [bacterium]|nr:aldo/keto reductase [bacterium]